MSLRINDTAPNFTALTTHGVVDFHTWIGDSWAVLFSHPKDFTPVCTTELGYMARVEPEFTKRNTKLIGLSVSHVARRWSIFWKATAETSCSSSESRSEKRLNTCSRNDSLAENRSRNVAGGNTTISARCNTVHRAR